MQRIVKLVVVLAGLAMFATSSFALSSYVTTFNSTYPAASATMGDCVLCHIDPNGGGTRNGYGEAFRTNGHNFKTIEPLDSDGDGFTNIAEIQALTWPGDATSHPAPAADTTAPTVTVFTIPGTASTLQVPITAFTATDNVGVTGYIITESSTKPTGAAAGWSATAPVTYAAASIGAHTLYAYAKDAAGNISTGVSASVTITPSDTVAPTVTTFTVPATATSRLVPITALTATDNVLVTGYLITESATKPAATAVGWSISAPTTYIATSAGTHTLYAYAKDAAGNISTGMSASVTITIISSTAASPSNIGVFRNGSWYLDVTGNGMWNAGDATYSFGLTGDIPVAGDWGGLGTVEIGVFRNGNWYLDYNGNGAWDGCSTDKCYAFGKVGDIPVVGDWSGLGAAGIGVFRNGNWYLDYNGNGAWDGCSTDKCYAFGNVGDIPVVGDWGNTGTVKIGVFRNGNWYLDYNGNGAWDGCGAPGDPSRDACFTFGLSTDTPLVGN